MCAGQAQAHPMSCQGNSVPKEMGNQGVGRNLHMEN